MHSKEEKRKYSQKTKDIKNSKYRIMTTTAKIYLFYKKKNMQT